MLSLNLELRSADKAKKWQPSVVFRWAAVELIDIDCGINKHQVTLN
jgi:hypothetical protein